MRRTSTWWCMVVSACALLWGASSLLAQDKQKDAVISVRWNDALGLYYYLDHPVLSKDLGIGKGQFLVAGVHDGGAAHQAGVRRADVVTGITGGIWKNPDRSGTITVLREGAQKTFQVTTRKHGSATIRLAGPKQANTPPRILVVDAAGKGNYRSLAGALAQARYGDTVQVNEGYYPEMIMPPNGVTVKARGKAVVASSRPIILSGSHGVALEGLTVVGGTYGGVQIMGAKSCTLKNCELLDAEKVGVYLDASSDIVIEGCSISGKDKDKSIGISAKRSTFKVADCTVSGFEYCLLFTRCTAEIQNSHIDARTYGLMGLDSDLTIQGNTFSGRLKGNGVYLSKGTAEVHKNIIGGYSTGILTEAVKGKVTKNTIRRNYFGIKIQASDVICSENHVMNNKYTGIAVGTDKKEMSTAKTVITRNTISNNGTAGIEVCLANPVITFNLIEANGSGIEVEQGAATIHNNTLIMQRWVAIKIAPGARATVKDNIVAFNRVGLKADVTSKLDLENNNVYGNISGTGFPLSDGNYQRTDLLPTQGGESLHILVYPAYDLKAPTDLSVDPKFVKMGSDYRLRRDSPLVNVKGSNGLPLGAFGVVQP